MDNFIIYLSEMRRKKRDFRVGSIFSKLPARMFFKKKFIMSLKYATLLIMISCLHVFASGHAQKVNLSAKNSTMLEVMEQIEKQTGYSFWLQTHLLRDKAKVNIQAKNANLTKIGRASCRERV